MVLPVLDTDFLIPDGFYGKVTIDIIINNHQKSKTVTLFDSNVDLWSDDVYEIVGVMRYIFTASEMRKMKNLSDKEKIDYIVAYWEKNDPNTETKINELLDELTIRFRFVNENLSDISEGSSWIKLFIFILIAYTILNSSYGQNDYVQK